MAWYRPLDMWRLRRARKAAGAAIQPLLDGSRRRLSHIPDSAWRDPYVIGFLSMLVTLHARQQGFDLSSDATGVLQAECFADMSGGPAAAIGAEICYLSSSRNGAFEAGCRGAAEMMACMVRTTSNAAQAGLSPGEDDVTQLAEETWKRLFDEHLSAASAASIDLR